MAASAGLMTAPGDVTVSAEHIPEGRRYSDSSFVVSCHDAEPSPSVCSLDSITPPCGESDFAPLFVDKKVAYVGAPFCDGQELGGVNEAPEALNEAGIKDVVEHLGWAFEDFGCLRFEGGVEDDKKQEGGTAIEVAEKGLGSDDRYHRNIKHSESAGNACRIICEAASKALSTRSLLLTVGGDHSIAAGTLTAVKKKYPDVAVVWVDAHGDCNTPTTSPSGNYHGMPAAHVMGWFEKKAPGFDWMVDEPPLPADRTAFIGLRDLDLEEGRMMLQKGVHCFTMQHLDRFGIAQVVERALLAVDPSQRRPIHLSLDIDACDPSVAPGTGTKARGGLTYREVRYICEALSETRRLVSVDLVEINPKIDEPGSYMHGDQLPINPEATQTVRLGIELVASLLGKVIL